jgi:hypothetical protein
MAITAIPILPVMDPAAAAFAATRIIEELTQTFKQGTPVEITAADGGIKAWDGTTGTAFTFPSANIGAIVGICYEAASNLSATGSGAPTPMSPFLGVGAVAGTFGSVQNQSSAKNIAHGAPLNDGRVGLHLASINVIFSATFGNNGNTATPANTDVGKNYGLTIDTGGNFWYVDKNKSTPGTNTVLQVVGLDLRDIPAAGTRVLFQFDPRFTQQLTLGA